MSDKSAIEWTDATWNPVVGCSIVSPGCTHCYAMGEAARQIRCAAGQGRETHYAGAVKIVKGKPVWTGKLALAPDSILLAPLKRKKPTIYFVNSMGDLFHEDCPDEWIDKVFAVMALASQHTFQVLTKRAQRMLDYFLRDRVKMTDQILGVYECIYVAMGDLGRQGLTDLHPFRTIHPNGMPWSLPNVWLGVSAERQQEAEIRIPLLLQTPAAKRFISAEPLLDELRLNSIWMPNEKLWLNALTGKMENCGGSRNIGTKIDWVIAGGESGLHARAMHPDWARSLRDQCAAAGVPFFFKQWGEYAPVPIADPGKFVRGGKMPFGKHHYPFHRVEGYALVRFGKKGTGRLLDGVEHNAMPEVGR